MCKWIEKWWGPALAFWAILAVWVYFDGYNMAMGDGSDKFDALNSLFAGLAFAGMLCTLFMQRQELGLQREELKATRKELHKTAEANQKTAELNEKQIRCFVLVEYQKVCSVNFEKSIEAIQKLNDEKAPEQIIGKMREILEGYNHAAAFFTAELGKEVSLEIPPDIQKKMNGLFTRQTLVRPAPNLTP